jgi:hypothetical protein
VRTRRGAFALSLSSCESGLLELRLELRQLAVLELRHLLPVALAARLVHLGADLVDRFLDVLRAGDVRLLGLPDLLEVGVLALEARDLGLDGFEALLRRFVLLLLDASRSILSWIMRRSSLSIDSGLESISILMRAAASSIRSIALSGRKRSVM